MPRVLTATVLLSLLVVSGGCLGSRPPPRLTSMDAETATTSHYDCPYYLQVDVASKRQISSAERTYEYDDLPVERQREFERAFEAGSTSVGEELPETWDAPAIIDYRGQQYATSVFVC